MAGTVGVEEGLASASREAGGIAQRGRVGVAVAGCSGPGQAMCLASSSLDDALARVSRRGQRAARKLVRRGALHADQQVDAIQQRAAEAPAVALDLGFGAATRPRRTAGPREAARARIS